jgi:hypothetical protein
VSTKTTSDRPSASVRGWCSVKDSIVCGETVLEDLHLTGGQVGDRAIVLAGKQIPS